MLNFLCAYHPNTGLHRFVSYDESREKGKSLNNRRQSTVLHPEHSVHLLGITDQSHNDFINLIPCCGQSCATRKTLWKMRDRIICSFGEFLQRYTPWTRCTRISGKYSILNLNIYQLDLIFQSINVHIVSDLDEPTQKVQAVRKIFMSSNLQYIT